MLPQKFALVMGTESTGASATMIQAADQRVYLPLHGWAGAADLLELLVLVLLVVELALVLPLLVLALPPAGPPPRYMPLPLCRVLFLEPHSVIEYGQG